MREDSSTRCWNELGSEWFDLAQSNDFRMDYIMPNTFRLLGDVAGLDVLDLGCGEGGYARELARRGARVTAVDCSRAAIAYASAKAEEEHLPMRCLVRNSNALDDVPEQSFDRVLCSMMLMDVEDFDGTLREVSRVLKSEGQAVVSVLHPCFKPPVEHHWFHGEDGVEVRVKNYFHPESWAGTIQGAQTTVIYRHRTLSEYVRTAKRHGLTLADLDEPIPSEEQCRRSPRIAWLTRIPMYMFMVLQK